MKTAEPQTDLHSDRVSQALSLVKDVPLGESTASREYFCSTVRDLLERKRVGAVLELLERLSDWLRFRGLDEDAARVDDDIGPRIVALFEEG